MTSQTQSQTNQRSLPAVKRSLKALLAAVAILFLIGALAYTLRAPLLTGLAGFLVVDDPLQPADIIFMLNGDVTTRPFHAAKLFEQGLAPTIVIPREEDSPASEIGLYPNGTDVSVDVLQQQGVPDESIIVIPVEGGVTSTRDEAKTLRQYINAHNVTEVILVTSAFHTRRARWIFNKELNGSGTTLRVSAAPHWEYDQTNWWQDERGLIAFANEYIKLVYYFAVY